MISGLVSILVRIWAFGCCSFLHSSPGLHLALGSVVSGCRLACSRHRLVCSARHSCARWSARSGGSCSVARGCSWFADAARFGVALCSDCLFGLQALVSIGGAVIFPLSCSLVCSCISIGPGVSSVPCDVVFPPCVTVVRVTMCRWPPGAPSRPWVRIHAASRGQDACAWLFERSVVCGVCFVSAVVLVGCVLGGGRARFRFASVTGPQCWFGAIPFSVSETFVCPRCPIVS